MIYFQQNQSLDEITIVATAMIMLIAGYDTTGSTLSYAGFELAKNQEIQDKLRAEVDAAFDECEEAGNEFPDYNTVQNLPYLDMVIHETLRRHPPLQVASRACVKDYVVPGGNGLVIKEGTLIDIPICGLHQDEEHYPNPKVFNPEHFSKEGKAKRHP